jgi:predicted phage gp36 major capsid-like protein
MKSILYVGATLMIGASIYGFVDYKKTSHNKEFTKMYDNKEEAEKNSSLSKPAEKLGNLDSKDEKNEAIESEVSTSTSNENNTEKKYKGKRKKLDYRLFSRAPLEEKYIQKELKTEEPKISEPKKTNDKEQ